MANSIASYNKTSLMYRNGQVMTRIKADMDVAMDTLSTIVTTNSEGLTTVSNFTNNTDGMEGGPGPFILYPSMMAPKEYAVPIYGFFTPFLIILTIVTNTLVCVVLMKKNMRSPTNTLLVAMAVSDMFTGIFPMPVFLHFFAFGYFQDYVSIDWCYLHLYFSDIIPTIFHTASIWLTMGLALQRYIYVCYSIKAKQWCTIPSTIKGIIVAYVLAILSQASKFGESTIDPIEVESLRTPGENFTGCLPQRRPWLENIEDIYYNIYFWFRVIFIHMIPCTSLVVLNALLIHAMKNAQKRRQMLLKQNRKSESKKLKDSNCTTLMLVAVVGVFLLVEVPQGVVFILIIVTNTFRIALLPDVTMNTIALFTNFFIIFSYPLNFFIYCGMSRQFRDTFRRLFSRGTAPSDREHSHYTALATENGKSAYLTTPATGDTAI